MNLSSSCKVCFWVFSLLLGASAFSQPPKQSNCKENESPNTDVPKTPEGAKVRRVAEEERAALCLTGDSRKDNGNKSRRPIVVRKGKKRISAPGRKWQNVLYVMTPFHMSDAPITDLQGEPSSEEEVLQLTASFRDQVDTEQHRYVGLVSAGKKGTNHIEKRFNAHAVACKSNPERRLPKHIIRRAQANGRLYVQVFLVNVHPDQLRRFETLFISQFDCTGDLGLNSCAGASSLGEEEVLCDDLEEEEEEEDWEVPGTLMAPPKFPRFKPDDGDDGSGACGGVCMGGIGSHKISAS